MVMLNNLVLASILSTASVHGLALDIEKREAKWGHPSGPPPDNWYPKKWALQNSGDGYCLQDYGSDGQLYSKDPTWSPVLFDLEKDPSTDSGYQLYGYVKQGRKACVGLEGYGTQNQFQCSGDPDNGPKGSGEDFSLGKWKTLLWGDSPLFYGCGNAQTGINFYVDKDGVGKTDPWPPAKNPNCKQSYLTFVPPEKCKKKCDYEQGYPHGKPPIEH